MSDKPESFVARLEREAEESSRTAWTDFKFSAGFLLVLALPLLLLACAGVVVADLMGWI